MMARALQLATLGLETTTPNPRVGCVIVRDGQVLAEGWHERAGAPHAEAAALAIAGEAARGATVYITLEPCAHHGRTPPCAEALVKVGVGRVIAAMSDPNPKVSGRGFALLEEHGIPWQVGLLEAEARELNIGFISRMTRGWPWVRLKAASTLDGKTALENGASQWITGPAARRDGHRWRARACALLTGFGTVRADDPQLTVRDVPCSRQPLRVVVDARLETPPTARILQGGNVLVACAARDEARALVLEKLGAEIVVLPNNAGKVDLPALLRALAARGINEVHVEAGFKLNGSLLREGYVDELLLYMAPMLFGDAAQGMFKLAAMTSLDQALRPRLHDVRRIGEDIRILARFPTRP